MSKYEKIVYCLNTLYVNKAIPDYIYKKVSVKEIKQNGFIYLCYNNHKAIKILTEHSDIILLQIFSFCMGVFANEKFL